MQSHRDRSRRHHLRHLGRRIHLLRDRAQPDAPQHIVVEASGVSDPLQLVQTFMLPELAPIVVDEPTAGLDPEERSRFHNLLSEIGYRIVTGTYSKSTPQVPSPPKD